MDMLYSISPTRNKSHEINEYKTFSSYVKIHAFWVTGTNFQSYKYSEI